MTNAVIDNSTKEELDRVILWQYDEAERLIALIGGFGEFFTESTKKFFDRLTAELDITDDEKCGDYGAAIWGIILNTPRPYLTYVRTVGSSTETSGIMSLSLYRRILIAKAKLLSSRGTFTDYCSFVDAIFTGEGNGVKVVDGRDMSLKFERAGGDTSKLADPELEAAFSQAYDVIFTVYPAGVFDNTPSEGLVFALDGQQKYKDADNNDVVVDEAGGLDESGFDWRKQPDAVAEGAT